MRLRINIFSAFSNRIIRGERILPLVLSISPVVPDDYQFIADNGAAQADGSFVYQYDGGVPGDVTFDRFIDGGDPYTAMPS